MDWRKCMAWYLNNLFLYGSYMGQRNVGIQLIRFLLSHGELFFPPYHTSDLNHLPLRWLTHLPLILCVGSHSPGVKDPTPFLARYDHLPFGFPPSDMGNTDHHGQIQQLRALGQDLPRSWQSVGFLLRIGVRSTDCLRGLVWVHMTSWPLVGPWYVHFAHYFLL